MKTEDEIRQILDDNLKLLNYAHSMADGEMSLDSARWNASFLLENELSNGSIGKTLDDLNELEDKFNQLQADNVKMLEFIQSIQMGCNSDFCEIGANAIDLLQELEG